jgi:glutaredoxin-like protein
VPLLSDEDRTAIRELLKEAISHPVQLVMFTQHYECAYCRETRQVLEELGELSGALDLRVLDFVDDAAQAEQYGVDKIPATLVLGAAEGDQGPVDYGIRFYGIPSGYEFASLLEAIKLVGSRRHSLSRSTQDRLAKLSKPLHLQVFVTPTCPYCPRAVTLAHQLAFASPLVTADMVEAVEYPHLAEKYHVMGVPRTVINEDIHIEGAVPEGMLVARLPAT